MEKEVKKNKKLYILLFVVIVAVLWVGYKSIDHYIEMHKVVVPEKSNYEEVTTKDEIQTDSSDESINDNTNNTMYVRPEKEKTEYELLLEKYTLGNPVNGQYSEWLPRLFNSKLTDEIKALIVLRNQDYSADRKIVKKSCKELFPDKAIKDDGTFGILEKDGKKSFCSNKESNYYDYNELNNDYHQLFGSSSDLPIFKDIIIFNHCCGGYTPYLYSDTVNGYVELSCNCGGTYGFGTQFYRVINTNKDDNNMIIDIAYLELDAKKINSTYSFNSPSGNNYEVNKNHDYPFSDIVVYNGITPEIRQIVEKYLCIARNNFNEEALECR